MQFIYILQLKPKYTEHKNWTEDTNRIVGEHFNYLKSLHEEGVVKFVGKTDYDIDHTDNRGISIFEATDLDAANKIMLNDPCIKNGVMTAVIHPFKIVFS